MDRQQPQRVTGFRDKEKWNPVLVPNPAFDETLQHQGVTCAAHYLPTGTPDRHLVVELRLLDKAGHTLKSKRHVLKRTVMWRPFILDLWDTRLPRWQPRSFYIDSGVAGADQPTAVEAVVWYYLVAESRRRRIGYDNREPMAFKVFEKRIVLQRPIDGGQG